MTGYIEVKLRVSLEHFELFLRLKDLVPELSLHRYFSWRQVKRVNRVPAVVYEAYSIA